MAGGPGSYVLGAEEKKELLDVIDNGALFRYGTPGVDGFQGKVATFEKEMAEQLGHKYVVATSSGTGSLMCCLAALGIGMGDEVIVPGYTFIASISTIVMMNAIPVLAEIDDSLTIDPDKIEELITPRTKAIVPVHMLGNPCKMDKIMEIARRAKDIGVELFVLDDGWFGKRDNDLAGLGDYNVNMKKLPHGLSGLAKAVREKGMEFGLWFEPEMVSPDSDLYRAHPDWCLHVKGRENSLARLQYVLDMSREDVRDNIFNQMSEVLANNKCCIVHILRTRAFLVVFRGAFRGHSCLSTFGNRL